MDINEFVKSFNLIDPNELNAIIEPIKSKYGGTITIDKELAKRLIETSQELQNIPYKSTSFNELKKTIGITEIKALLAKYKTDPNPANRELLENFLKHFEWIDQSLIHKLKYIKYKRRYIAFKKNYSMSNGYN